MKHHRHEKTIGDRFKALIAYDPLAGFRKKRRRHGGRVNLASHISEQAKAVDTAPTDGQKEAGNYRKGHVKVHGLDISIENPRGSYRSGVADGKAWKSRLPNHYGYIRKTEGGDGQHVDVYLGPHLKAPNIYIIDQHHLAGERDFDEHKCFIGFGSKSQAVNAYHHAFSDGKGKDRIGHVKTMTIDGFKDWLKNADTTQPVEGHRRRFAAGGAVEDIPHMADGGSPVTDPTILAKLNEPTPVTDPKILEQLNAPAESDRGALSAALQGAKAGATFNFNDELAGIHAAKPAWVPEGIGPVPTGMIAGAGRLGLNAITGKDPEALAAYEHARDEEREASKVAQEQHPYTYMAGEVAGGLAVPVGGGAGAATVPLRMGRAALIGAGTGAMYGAGSGEDATHRLTGAAIGAGTGAVVGAAAPAVVEGALQAASRIVQPIIRSVQGMTNLEGESGRRVITGLQRDFDRQRPSLTPEEIAAANAAGSPRAIIDAGGDTTHALARSSANTSPEARAALTGLVQDRFGTQNDRAAGFVQHLTGATGDNPAAVEALQTAARQANRPAYARAYRDGQAVWTPEIEQLTQAPAVQSAIRDATQTGANRAALDGFQPVRNPFEFDATGRMTLRTNPDGSQAIPPLQFWDHVKRNLDDQYNRLNRAGARSEAADVNGLRQALLGNLDQAVPSYQTARSGAARFFGAQDALEAGSQFVTSRMNNAEAQRAFNRMSAPEQALFRQGYASSLINKIGEMGDRRTILNSIANSPAERQRMEIALGPQNARAMEAFLRAEGIMDRARNAVTGNSTTARQLAELGLAGGAYGIEGLHGGFSDPRAIGTAVVVWGLTHGSNRINERVARRVGEMLASHDPAVLNQGVQLIARNARIFNALRSMDGFSKIAGQHNPFGRFQGPMGARADDEKKKP